MKLVACPECHAHYDVSDHGEATVSCPCGATFSASPPPAKDAAVTRCAACGALAAERATTCTYCGAEIARRPEPSGPVCPECYARNPLRARHCAACGIAFVPQPVRRRDAAPECPVCAGVRLAARSLGGLWVDECPMCLGIWAPGDVMDRLVERVRERRRRDGAPPAGQSARERRRRDGAPPAGQSARERRAAWQRDVAYRRCPSCGGTMQRRNFGRRSGVVVDWCGSHGTWLDAHEMEDIAAFVREGGLETGPADASERPWSLPADPERTAAILAAERILAEERARSIARERKGEFEWNRAGRGWGDFFSELLKP